MQRVEIARTVGTINPEKTGLSRRLCGRRMRPMKLTPTQAQRAFVPLIALAMSGFMSVFMTAVNFGVGPDFLSAWLRNWLLAFTVALPTALLVVPLIRNGLARVTVPSSSVPSPLPPHGHETVTRASIPSAP